MKYIKKPVVVEAIKYEGDFIVNGIFCAHNWIKSALDDGTLYFKDQGELYVKTLEGDHHVSAKDFIIQGIKGELYPCKPDIFHETYDVYSGQ